MRTSNIWKWLILLLVSVITFAVLSGFSQRALVISHLLSQLSDYEIEIGAIDNMNVGETVLIEASAVRVTSTELAMQAGWVQLELGLSERQLRVHSVKLKNSEVEIRPLSTTASHEVSTPDSDSELFSALPQYYDFEEVTVSYRDEDQNWRLRLRDCHGSKMYRRTSIFTDCRGQLNDEAFVLIGHYGFLDPTNALEPLDLVLIWDDFRLSATGKLDSLLRLTNADVRVMARASSNKDLLALLGIHEVEESAVDFDFELKETQGQYRFVVGLAMGAFEGQVSGASSAIIDQETLPQEYELDFKLSGSSLFEFGALFDELSLVDAAFSMAGQVRSDSPSVSATGLKFEVGALGKLEGEFVIPRYPALNDSSFNLTATQILPAEISSRAGSCDYVKRPIDLRVQTQASFDGHTALKADLGVDKLQVEVSGLIPGRGETANLSVRLSGFDPSQLGACVSLSLPKMTVDGDFMLAPNSTGLQFTDLELTSEWLEVSGASAISFTGLEPFEVNLELNVKDAAVLGEQFAPLQGKLKPVDVFVELQARGNAERVNVEKLKILQDENRIESSGEFEQPLGEARFSFQISGEGDNLGSVLNDQERTTLSALPYKFDLKAASANDKIDVRKFDFRIARSEFFLKGKFHRETPFEFAEFDLKGKGQNLENLLGIWIDHKLPAKPFEFGAKLQVNKQHVTLRQGMANVGSLKAKADFIFDQPPNHQSTQGQISIDGTSTHELLELIDYELDMLDRPFSLSLSLQGNESSVDLFEIDFEIAESNLSGETSIQFLPKPTFTANLLSTSLYLPLLFPKLLEPETVESKQSLPANIFSAETLELGWMNAVDGQLRLDLEKVWMNQDIATRLFFDVSLEAGNLTSDEMTWSSPHSHGQLQLRLLANSMPAIVETKIDGTRFPFVWLFASDIGDTAGTAFNVDLSATGSTQAEFISSLEGHLFFKDGKAKLKNQSLDRWFGDFFHNLSSRLISGTPEKQTNITCSAGGIAFLDGQATLNPGLVLRTDRMDLFGTGVFDLKKEELKLKLASRPRTGLGISPVRILSPRMQISGPLSKPSYSVDPTGSALSTSVAFLTGGTSILATAIWDRLNASKEACDLLFDEASKVYRP